MRRGKGLAPLEGPRLAGTQIRIPSRQSGRFLAGFVSPKDSFRRRNLSNRAGFTLIELLVVISILVLLMAILLPTLQRVRKQARAIACQSNLRQWGTILALYVEDNQGRLPRTIARWFIGASLLGEHKPRLKGRDIKDILCCPSAVKHRETLDPNDRPYYDYTFRAWEARYFRLTFHGSYGFNEWLLLGPINSFPGSSYGTDVFLIRGNASIPVLLDSTRPGRHPFDRSGLHGPLLFRDLDWPFCINRHNGHINGLFLDWSVRKIGLKELWTLKWHVEFDTAGPYTKAGGALPEDWPQWMRRFKDY